MNEHINIKILSETELDPISAKEGKEIREELEKFNIENKTEVSKCCGVIRARNGFIGDDWWCFECGKSFISKEERKSLKDEFFKKNPDHKCWAPTCGCPIDIVPTSPQTNKECATGGFNYGMEGCVLCHNNHDHLIPILSKSPSPSKDEKDHCIHTNEGVCDTCVSDREISKDEGLREWEVTFREEFKAYFTPAEMNIAVDVVDTLISSMLHARDMEIVAEVESKKVNFLYGWNGNEWHAREKLNAALDSIINFIMKG